MSSPEQVWIVDDDESIRWVLQKAIEGAGMQATGFPGAAELLDALESAAPDVLISDIRMPGVDGLELLSRVNSSHPRLPIIIMTAHSDLDSAVAAYRGGAFEYLPKPFDVDDAIALIHRAVGHQKQSDKPAPTSGVEDAPPVIGQMIGEAPAMQEVFRAIGRLSHSVINVMVTGESGTGKELVASALHQHSPRADRAFIAINTAAIPKDLLESEFFGHERGAFTGAATQRRGRFEQADGGTLFLDEIGDMTLELQTRLLRVLSDGQFFRVGGHEPVKVDVRVIAATNRNLEADVAAGKFREDLYHRLNVIRIRIPSLRERRTDIPQLVEHFMSRAAVELKVDAKRIHKDVLAHLATLDWPGNVRQLENVCRWLTVMAPAAEVRMEDLPPELGQPMSARSEQAAVNLPGTSHDEDWRAMLRRWARHELSSGHDDLLADAVPDMERVMIEVALEHTRGRRQEAAKLLGWGRNTLTRKIKELGMEQFQN